MKRFYQIPKTYQSLSVGILSALTMISVGIFVSAILPKPRPANSSPASGSNATSSIEVTPITPNRAYTPPPVPPVPSSVPSAPQTPTADFTDDSTELSSTAPEQVSPISPEAIAGNSNSPVATTEPYDDVVAARFNHLAYAEADPTRIESIGLFKRDNYEREEFLDYEAAAAFTQMKADAAEEGIGLMPISGFRTIALQAELFDKQVEKIGSEAAAELSAPPGHSEHHTGYAIDIGDTARPEADLKRSFENTRAYLWLVANAKSYGFEESFPDGNQQGVNFEPWHWRFVGSERASEIFNNGRYLFPAP